jgi:endonuclease/exonuclease/phosphatase family metal-dependent hydrolase
VGEIRTEIESMERKHAIDWTVLVGDFNMDPFSTPMVAATGFHGVRNKSIAHREARSIEARSYRFFYNPMWSFLTNAQDPVGGTHYFNPARPVNYFWHIYDQVLVRPALIDRLENIAIPEAAGNVSLVTKNGLPNVSDHLPLHFTLNLR